MRDLEERAEREALCPDCGTGFRVYVDRIVPDDPKTGGDKDKYQCPHCGCRECRLSDSVK
jgi:predicted RNA-binding Zn-ribbon protein involved in translation (DUF1610 family)